MPVERTDPVSEIVDRSDRVPLLIGHGEIRVGPARDPFAVDLETIWPPLLIGLEREPIEIAFAIEAATDDGGERQHLRLLAHIVRLDLHRGRGLTDEQRLRVGIERRDLLADQRAGGGGRQDRMLSRMFAKAIRAEWQQRFGTARGQLDRIER